MRNSRARNIDYVEGGSLLTYLNDTPVYLQEESILELRNGVAAESVREIPVRYSNGSTVEPEDIPSDLQTPARRYGQQGSLIASLYGSPVYLENSATLLLIDTQMRIEFGANGLIYRDGTPLDGHDLAALARASWKQVTTMDGFLVDSELIQDASWVYLDDEGIF